jgi:hypothetical protein
VNTREIFKSGYEDRGYTTTAKNAAKYGAEETAKAAKYVANVATEGAKYAANKVADNIIKPVAEKLSKAASVTKKSIVNRYNASKHDSQQNVTKRIQKLKDKN